MSAQLVLDEIRALFPPVLSTMALSGGRPDLWLSEDRRSARFVKLLLCLALLGSTTASSTLEARYDHAALPSGAGHEGVGAGASTKGYAWLIVVHGILGFLALQVIAPLAVVIAAVGRSWPNNLWFRMHWKMQAYGSWPVLLLAVTFAFIASTVGRRERGLLEPEPLDLHQQMGFTLLGLVGLQLFLGYYSHARERAVQTFAQSENPGAEKPPKRRATNWSHILLGIVILTLGGLQISWGFDEYEKRLGREVPMWIQIVHFAVAGVAPVIITPFIIVRGLLRMRRGQTFAQAFFGRDQPEPYQPPRRMFLNTSDYLEQAQALGPGNDPEKDEVGTSYEKGHGADGRLRVDSQASNWPGAATREEYEHEVASTVGHGSIVSTGYDEGSLYDYAASNSSPVVSHARRVVIEEEKSSLLSSAAPMGSSGGLGHEKEQSAAGQGGGGRPSQIPYRLPCTSPTYPPPAPAQVFVPPPMLPPIEPISSPPAPPRTASMASRIAKFSSFSPRLAFMPFSGSTPAGMPTPTETPSNYSCSVVSAGSGATTLFVYEEPAQASAVFVPSPPPVPPRPTAYTPGSSIATDLAVEDDSVAPRKDITPTLTRAVSSAAQIEDADADAADGTQSPASVIELAQQPKLQLELTNPDPPSDQEDGAVTAKSPFADDSESLRLMDELERELTISTTRSGRRARADASPEAGDDTADAAVPAEVAEETASTDQATALAREQSGKWLAGGK